MNRRQSMREWAVWFMHFHSYARITHYALAAYCGARVPRVTRRSHARVRVSYECRCGNPSTRLLQRPPVVGPSTATLDSADRLYRRRLSRPWSIARIDSARTRTRRCYLARSRKRYQIDRHRLRSRIAPIDNKIKGRTREKWSVAARRWLLLGRSLRYVYVYMQQMKYFDKIPEQISEELNTRVHTCISMIMYKPKESRRATFPFSHL